MAIVWQHRAGDHTYKVTRAGRCVRLYRNGVLHSQWNPNALLSGHLWELFILTSIAAQTPPQRVCILGTGGGSVIKLLQHFFPGVHIDAVELDEVHLFAAKKFFQLNNCQLYHADAYQWQNQNKHKQYDLIIDDVFTELSQVPHRALTINQSWLKKLLTMLTAHGQLVINFADASEWRHTRHVIKQDKFFQRYQFAQARHHRCDNRVIMLARHDLSATNIKHQLRNAKQTKMLNYLQQGIFGYRRIAINYLEGHS